MKAERLSIARLLGVLLAAIAGIATVPSGDWAARTFGGMAVGLVWAVVAALVAGVSGWLLGTWWALLLVPTVYLVGWEVGAASEAAVRGSLYSVPYALQYLLLGAGVFVYTLLLPLLVGAALGTAVAKRTVRR